MPDVSISDDRLEAYVDSVAAFLALPLTPEYHPGVLSNLRVLADFFDLIMQAPLDEHDEPAPVFRANPRA